MSIVTWLKLAGAAALLIWAYHLGGDASQAKLEALEALQSSNTAKAVLAQKAASDAEEARLNSVIAKYEATPIDPVAIGLAGRVLQYARLTECPVSQTATTAGGTGNTPTKPPGDPELERLSQAAIDACDHDAHQVIALQQAWPR